MLFKVICSEDSKVIEIDRNKKTLDLKEKTSNAFGKRLQSKEYSLKTTICSSVKLHDNSVLSTIPSDNPSLQAELVEGNPVYTLYVEFEHNVKKSCTIL